MKRFDYALDLNKQILTLASAFIGGAIAFYGNVFKTTPTAVVFFVFLAGIACWMLSVVSGIWGIGALANVAERQEQHQANNEPKFVSLFDHTLVVKFFRWQQNFFVLGIVLFLLSFLLQQTGLSIAFPRLSP